MRWIASLLFAVVIVTGLATCINSSSGQSNQLSTPIYGIEMPDGYRDWRMISVADVGTPVNDLRVKLGNDIAIKAYRDNIRPFPDGSIIARLAYQQVPSEENNKVFRFAAEQRGLPADQIEKLLAASFVAGPPTNVQFMIKDSKKYSSTGGWVSRNLPTADPTAKRYTKPAFPAMCPPKISTLSSPVIHLNTENQNLAHITIVHR